MGYQQAMQKDRRHVFVVGDVEAEVELWVGKSQEGQTGHVKMLVAEEKRRTEDQSLLGSNVHFVFQRLGKSWQGPLRKRPIEIQAVPDDCPDGGSLSRQFSPALMTPPPAPVAPY